MHTFFLNTPCICCMLHLVCYVYQSAQLGHFLLFTSQTVALCSFGAKHVIFVWWSNRAYWLAYTLQKFILRKLPLIAPQLCSCIMRPSAWLRKLNYFNRAIMMQHLCNLSYKSSSQNELYSTVLNCTLSNLSMTIAVPKQWNSVKKFLQSVFLSSVLLFISQTSPASVTAHENIVWHKSPNSQMFTFIPRQSENFPLWNNSVCDILWESATIFLIWNHFMKPLSVNLL